MNPNARNNQLNYIEFLVASPDALREGKHFYAKVFGWTYKDWGPEYSDTESSGITSGITIDAEHANRTLPVIFANDLEGTRSNAVAAGAKITKDIFSFPGGRRFQFTDPAGNELAVWSDK